MFESRMSRPRGGVVAVAVAAALVSFGCAAEQDPEAMAARAVAAAKPNWKLQLEWGGGPVEVPIDRMDIYLVEDEDDYPEIFEIHGSDVMLVGSFPMDIHVGYSEAFDKLRGKRIPISPTGGDPREPKTSWVKIAGGSVPVSGGTFTVEKVTGNWKGSEGDKTLWGTIELRIPGVNGDRSVKGKIGLHAVTWG